MPSAKRVPISARIIDDYQSVGENPQEQPTDAFSTTFEALYTWYSKMPEVRGAITTLVSDVFGEGYGIDGKDARVKKTQTFLKQNRFLKCMKSVTRDMFLTGNGYLGKASINEGQVMALAESVYGNVMQKSADEISIAKMMGIVKAAKPDIYSPSVLFPLKSRAIRINYDENGKILGYWQKPKSKGSDVDFAPEEVIHFAYETMGDDIYGTSPFYSCMYDLASLWYAKSYGGYFFQNDASPARIYTMEDEPADSENYKKFCEQLKTHRSNPHKSMVITGKVSINDIGTFNKDLEFGNFIDKYTQRVLMAVGMTSRFSHLFTGRLETPANLESYYKMINGIQSEMEEQLNQELFEHFDTEFYFNRVYKRDETREADLVTKLTGGKPIISQNEAREYVGYKKRPDAKLDEIVAEEPQDTPLDDVQAADARSDQNVDNPTSPGNMKGDKPINNKNGE